MRKTSVYLAEDLKAALAREAAWRGASEADVIHAALREAVVRPVPTAGLFEAVPFAERVDDLLDGFGER